MNIRKFWRSSISGHFVRRSEAEASPDTTQEEEAHDSLAAAWERFVDSEEYSAALYYASTPEARPSGLRVAFEAGRRRSIPIKEK